VTVALVVWTNASMSAFNKLWNKVLGYSTQVPGIGTRGVYDFATLIEDLDYEPNRCVIVGGSKVALEYGSFFQATGCQTTILTRSPLMETANLHHVDAGLRDYVVAMMAERGIEIVVGAELLEVLGNGRVTGVRYRAPGGQVRQIDTDFVFIGTGERPDLSMYAPLGLATDERGFDAAVAATKQQLAFYGSTPAYRPVLELHGWGELQPELHLLSRRGAWEEMAALIDDEMLRTFAVVGELDTIGATVRERFGDLVDRFSVYAPHGIAPERWAEVLAGLRS